MAAARVDCGCHRRDDDCRLALPATRRRPTGLSRPLVAADVLARSRAVLCTVGGLWRSTDFRARVVAIFILQRALWIAAASGFCGRTGYPGASGVALWRLEFSAARGGRAGGVC